MAAENNFLTGITEYLILSILSKRSAYIYEIEKSIPDLSNGKIVISGNTIYTSAYKLENAGLISSHSELVGRKRTRVYYSLEPKGKEQLEKLDKMYRDVTCGVNMVLARINDDSDE